MKKILVLGWILVFAIVFTQSCSSSEPEEKVVKVANEKGKKIWKTYCILCHGVDGKLGLNGAMDLSASILTLDERINVITNGRNTMVPYKGVIEDDEIRAAAEYTMSFKPSE